MPLTTKRAPSFEGVAAGQTATCRLPIGRTFHRLLIPYSGATLAQLNGVRVVANGETIHDLGDAAAVVDVLSQYEGRAAFSGVLVIDFDRFGMLTRQGQILTALGTGAPNDPRPISTLSVEVDIDAAAVAPVLGPIKMIQSAAKPNGLIKKVKKYTYNAPGAGVYEISDLPKGPIFNKVYFFSPSAVINDITVERDNFIVFERTQAENESIQTDGVRVPQSGLYVYDPTEDGYAAEGLVTAGVNDLRFKLNMAGAGVITAYVETLDTIDG